jgi:hypothetical protein
MKFWKGLVPVVAIATRVLLRGGSGAAVLGRAGAMDVAMEGRRSPR